MQQCLCVHGARAQILHKEGAHAAVRHACVQGGAHLMCMTTEFFFSLDGVHDRSDLQDMSRDTGQAICQHALNGMPAILHHQLQG